MQWCGAYELPLVGQAICDVLAEGREGEPGGAPPAKLSLEHVVALKPLLPLSNAFQLLIQPLPARGLGLRLKRALEKPKPGKLCEGADMVQLYPFRDPAHTITATECQMLHASHMRLIVAWMLWTLS